MLRPEPLPFTFIYRAVNRLILYKPRPTDLNLVIVSPHSDRLLSSYNIYRPGGGSPFDHSRLVGGNRNIAQLRCNRSTPGLRSHFLGRKLVLFCDEK